MSKATSTWDILATRLKSMDDKRFEEFCLVWLRTPGLRLRLPKSGGGLEALGIQSISTVAGDGKAQKGIDLIARMEDGSICVFQCKRVRKWTAGETKKVIDEWAVFKARHYILMVTVEADHKTDLGVPRLPEWEIWNLTSIGVRIRDDVRPEYRDRVLSAAGLTPEEIKRFLPWSTDVLLSWERFFQPRLEAGAAFHHAWPLIGRGEELAALRAFAENPKSRAMILSASGGQGKSRLLLEFARTMEREKPDYRVLFWNPAGRGLIEPALGGESPILVVVDDAHRPNFADQGLLAALCRHPSAKVLLATRPQGVSMARGLLDEAGFAHERIAKDLVLGNLSPKDLEALARASLPSQHADLSKALVQRVDGSPFLITFAGQLMKKGLLSPSLMDSRGDFRRKLFAVFEQENLIALGGTVEGDICRRALRILSLVSPFNLEKRESVRGLARLLDRNEYVVEELLQKLRLAELLSGLPSQLRVVPDLFSDYLAYDVVFDPAHRIRSLLEKTAEAFPGSRPALLANLAEAAWVGGDGLGAGDILNPLIKSELQEFQKGDWTARQRILQRWTDISVFLPVPAVRLARLAMDAQGDNRELSVQEKLSEEDLRSDRSDVLASLPALLTPVIRYHAPPVRHDALDALWELGRRQFNIGNARDVPHGWSAIASAMEYHRRTGQEQVLDYLDWLGRVLPSPACGNIWGNGVPILRSLVGILFAKEVRWFDWVDDKTGSYGWSLTDLEWLKPVWDKCLELLRLLTLVPGAGIQLHILATLEKGLESPVSLMMGKVPQRMLDTWDKWERPLVELIRDIAINARVPVVVHRAREILRAYVLGSDSKTVRIAREVLGALPSSLETRLCTVLLSDRYSEWREEMIATRPTLSHAEESTLLSERWERLCRDAWRELSAAFPKTNDLADDLIRFSLELEQFGFAPNCWSWFGLVASDSPESAAELARFLLKKPGNSNVHRGLVRLASGNAAMEDDEQMTMLHAAADSDSEAMRSAATTWLLGRLRLGRDHTEAESVWSRLVMKADTTQCANILSAIRGMSPPDRVRYLMAFRHRPGLAGESRLFRPLLAALAGVAVEEDDPENIPMVGEACFREILFLFAGAQSLGLHDFEAGERALLEAHALTTFDFFHQRLRLLEAGAIASWNEAIPGYSTPLALRGLSSRPDLEGVLHELWEKASAPPGPNTWAWRRLFQMVVPFNQADWHDLLCAKAAACDSEREWHRVIGLFDFSESGLIFNHPSLARRLLEIGLGRFPGVKAESFYSSMLSASVYPNRAYSNGRPDDKTKAILLAAEEADRRFHQDAVLGPFYRWVIQRERLENAEHEEQFISGTRS